MNDRTHETGNSHMLGYEGGGGICWDMRGGCEHETHGRLITIKPAAQKTTQPCMIMMKLQVCLSLIIVPIFLGGGGVLY